LRHRCERRGRRGQARIRFIVVIFQEVLQLGPPILAAHYIQPLFRAIHVLIVPPLRPGPLVLFLTQDHHAVQEERAEKDAEVMMAFCGYSNSEKITILRS
jgi:hypothetical protein